MKKQIRVLTGCHAGARLKLDPGAYRIGREADADIQVSDWSGHAMELHYRDDGVAILVAPGQVSSAAAMRSPEALQRASEQANLDKALAGLRMADLRVVRDRDATVVTGIVGTPDDKARVAGVVQRFGNLAVATRLTVAQNIADELQSSLGEPEVSVKYAGDGTFRVSGIASDVQDLQQRVDRARADFGGSIRRIAFDLKERATPDTSVSSMLATESLRYVELADGTKSFAELPATIDPNTATEK